MPYVPRSGDITTIAGTGIAGYSGDGGAAVDAELYGPAGVVVDDNGNVIIADTRNSRIRKIDPQGRITTIAGTGAMASGGDGGPAVAATLSWPSDLGIDGAGNVYVLESRNLSDEGARVRKIDIRGIISTVAGGGPQTSQGQDGVATQVWMAATGMGVDRAGNIFTTERATVRKIDTNGNITTIAGAPGRLVTPGNGDGGPATQATLEWPLDVTADDAGNVYIAATRVRKIDTSGVIRTVAGTATAGHSGDGGPATAAQLTMPNSITLDRAGNLYVTDLWRCWCIRKIDTSGIISTVAGGGTDVPGDRGPATKAVLGQLAGMAVDPSGNLIIGDSFCTWVGHYECVSGLDKPITRVRKVWA